MNQVSTDEQLLASFIKGDKQAFADLASRYEQSLLGLARAMLSDPSLACDAVQETWVRVIKYGRSFKQTSSFKTWIYRILINRCNEIRRTKWNVKEVVSQFRITAVVLPPEIDTARDNGTLRSAVGRLKPHQRDVVLLCYHRGMTHEQASEILRIPLGTLKSRINAALKQLREQLQEEQLP